MAISREDIQKEEGLAELLFEEDMRELEKHLKVARRKLRTLWNKLKDIVREEGVNEKNYKDHLEKNPQLTKLLRSLLILDKKKYVVNLVYKTVFGIENIRTDDRIDFVGGIRGVQELKRLVDSGRYAVAFSLYPASVEQLLRVADAGEVMPPKSTWFEPKLRSGLVVNLLDFETTE